MKIEKKEIKNTITFKTLFIGCLFLCDDRLMMKVKKGTLDSEDYFSFNAITVGDGVCLLIKGDEEVIEIATVSVTY